MENEHTIGALESFLHDVDSGESELEEIFNIIGYNELKYLLKLAKKGQRKDDEHVTKEN